MPRGISPLDEARQQARLWTPQVILPALRRWVAADALGTLTFGSGLQVASWANVLPTPENAAFTQSTAGDRGDWSATAFRGRPGIVLGGTDNYTSTGTITLGNRFEAVVACSLAASTAFYGRLLGLWIGGGFDFNAADAIAILTRDGVGEAVVATQNGTNYGPVAVTYDRPHILRCSCDGTTLRLYRDGALLASAGNSATIGAGTLGIGAYSALNTAAWNGVVAEVVVAAGAEANFSGARIEGFLAHKSGIGLAASHPWRNGPPLIGA